MKHTLLYIGMVLASFMMQPATVQAKAQKEAKVVKQLVVLHTNDTHSCVMPINPNPVSYTHLTLPTSDLV